jgi:membrane complex biogenesis BtpA family protein
MAGALFERLFGVKKPVIAMVHFPPLPGTPQFDAAGGVHRILDSIRQDLEALQGAGVDAVMFGNEGDRPYQLQVDVGCTATMAYAIGRVTEMLRLPFGVDVLWDPHSTLALAMATGARFCREIFTGVYASDMGLWNTDPGETLRYRRLLGAESVALFFNICAEFAAPVSPRPLGLMARSAVFSSLADAICVSGPLTGESASLEAFRTVREAVPETPIIANTGVREDTVREILPLVDGMIVGTSLKRDGVTWNPVDPERARRFMEVVRSIR